MGYFGPKEVNTLTYGVYEKMELELDLDLAKYRKLRDRFYELHEEFKRVGVNYRYLYKLSMD
jgi:hypothetical protein